MENPTVEDVVVIGISTAISVSFEMSVSKMRIVEFMANAMTSCQPLLQGNNVSVAKDGMGKSAANQTQKFSPRRSSKRDFTPRKSSVIR